MLISNHKGSNEREKKGNKLVSGCHGQRPCYYLRNQPFVITRKQTLLSRDDKILHLLFQVNCVKSKLKNVHVWPSLERGPSIGADFYDNSHFQISLSGLSGQNSNNR